MKSVEQILVSRSLMENDIVDNDRVNVILKLTFLLL